jgi:hypothetical protein
VQSGGMAMIPGDSALIAGYAPYVWALSKGASDNALIRSVNCDEYIARSAVENAAAVEEAAAKTAAAAAAE